MSRVGSCFVAAILLLLSMTAAHAKDDRLFDWSGFYAGADLGFLHGNSDYAYFNPLFHAKPEPAGIVGGLHLGYRWHLPSDFVLGIEADAWLSGAEDRADFNPFVRAHVEVQTGGSVRGVLGRSFGRSLLYVTGGLALAKHSSCSELLLAGYICGLQSALSVWRPGWTAGAGIAHHLSDRWILRAEYLYADFGTEVFRSSFLSGGGLGVDLKTHTFRFGISRRFGGL